MDADTRHELRNKAASLAALLIRAKSARVKFRSEAQFLEMLGLEPELEPVRVERPARRSRTGIRTKGSCTQGWAE
jgi:hypothetical protein